MKSKPIVTLSLVGALCMAACGPSASQETVADAGGGASTKPGKGDGGAGGDPGSIFTGPAQSGTGPACASLTQKAEGVPVALVFLIDRSRSMAGVKWQSVTTTLSSFLLDSKTQGISAALTFFPSTKTDSFFSLDDKCSADLYKDPQVPMVGLPNATFKAALTGIGPDGMGTPVSPAMRGAYNYVMGIKKASAMDNLKVAAVLVTDGEPTGCGSSVAEVSTVAKEYAATMPTYVVGVGTSLGNLNAIAEAGGTKKAFIVTDNGVETAKALGQALEEIRGAQISCDYKFPKQEGEKKFDVDKVNVVFSSGGANSTTFPYSKDCSVKGWRYDNVSAPTKIELCPETCAAVKSDTAAQVDVQFGCETLGGVPR